MIRATRRLGKPRASIAMATTAVAIVLTTGGGGVAVGALGPVPASDDEGPLAIPASDTEWCGTM
jgi:hypothetical protein